MSTDSEKVPANSHVERSTNLSARISIAWLLPIAAVLFAFWVLWQNYIERGPLVEIIFDKAGGVVAGETVVRRNDVDVGRVESVRLADDLNSVLVGVRLDPLVSDYLDDETRFWIVNARINTTEISGLSTLLSGSYIEVDWDDIPGEKRTEFIGLQEPPLTARGTPGLRLTLNADEAGYIYMGSPVFLRQVEVGRVERRSLNEDATQVQFDIFIEAPFHENVYPETRFYGVSGVEGRFDAHGASVRVESLSALFTGGIAFDNPPEITDGDPVVATGREFKLYDSRTDANESVFDGADDELYRLIANFEGSVKGLRRDAQIEYNGITVGKVLSVAVKLPEKPSDPSTSVVVLQLQPVRLGLDDPSQESFRATVDSFVQSGLRAQLATGNLLTGSLIVKLVRKPDLLQESMDFTAEPYPAIPSVPSNVEAVTADVETLIKNLSELPLNSMVSSATQLLQETRQLIASPEIAQLPGQIVESMSSLTEATANLPTMVRSLTRASDNANNVLEGLSPDSEIYIELSAAARELRSAAKSIASFAELLEENPNAIITGR